MPVITLRLQEQCRLQYMAESFVLDNRPRIHLRQPVVAFVRQVRAIGPQFDPAVWILENINITVNQQPVYRVSLSR